MSILLINTRLATPLEVGCTLVFLSDTICANMLDKMLTDGANVDAAAMNQAQWTKYFFVKIYILSTSSATANQHVSFVSSMNRIELPFKETTLVECNGTFEWTHLFCWLNWTEVSSCGLLARLPCVLIPNLF